MDKYYTLKGYKLRNKSKITEAMEDYIEMIYKNTLEKPDISIKEISNLLNVKYSSTTNMLDRLKKLQLVNYDKYKKVYICIVHNIIVTFLRNYFYILTYFQCIFLQISTFLRCIFFTKGQVASIRFILFFSTIS